MLHVSGVSVKRDELCDECLKVSLSPAGFNQEVCLTSYWHLPSNQRFNLVIILKFGCAQ